MFVADRIVPANASLEGLPEPWRIQASEGGVGPLPASFGQPRWIPGDNEPIRIHVVELPIEVEPGRPSVLVSVVDQTGHVVEAGAATSAKIAVHDITTNTVWITDLPDGRCARRLGRLDVR